MQAMDNTQYHFQDQDMDIIDDYNKLSLGKYIEIQAISEDESLEEIDRQAQLHNKRMDVLVQVNIAGEEQKGGLPPEEVIPFLRACSVLPGLQVKGLMAIMPLEASREELDGYFAGMRALFDRCAEENIENIQMQELSMGMSRDFDLAARHGATMVRVGSLLFQ